LALTCVLPPDSRATNLAVAFMNCTYEIQSHKSVGTAFIIGQPVAGNPGRSHLVLITAAHLLETMHAEKALLHARVRQGNGWIKKPWPITIRQRGRALWTRHPDVDLAAMRIDLPGGSNATVPTLDVVATDRHFERFEIQPGEHVVVLGYPLGLGGSEAGFPLARGGMIASYPLTPIRQVKTFLIDFDVFPGNSGGPVVLVSPNRVLRSGVRMGVTQMLLGVVSRQVLSAEPGSDGDGDPEIDRRLSMARVIHAGFILDLIARLPAP
jgi:S1-C subfamily serine protease